MLTYWGFHPRTKSPLPGKSEQHNPPNAQSPYTAHHPGAPPPSTVLLQYPIRMGAHCTPALPVADKTIAQCPQASPALPTKAPAHIEILGNSIPRPPFQMEQPWRPAPASALPPPKRIRPLLLRRPHRRSGASRCTKRCNSRPLKPHFLHQNRVFSRFFSLLKGPLSPKTAPKCPLTRLPSPRKRGPNAALRPLHASQRTGKQPLPTQSPIPPKSLQENVGFARNLEGESPKCFLNT